MTSRSAPTPRSEHTVWVRSKMSAVDPSEMGFNKQRQVAIPWCEEHDHRMWPDYTELGIERACILYTEGHPPREPKCRLEEPERHWKDTQ